VPTLGELTRTPNALAPHYSRFRVAQRLLLSGHSHQAWPDVAREAQLEAFDDAARHVDDKWSRAFAKAERVRQGYRALLDEPAGEIALGTNTHELLVRWLSALDLVARPRLLTTDGEFHTIRRQLSRLAELGLEVVPLPARPAATLAERLARAIDERTGAVLVSAVLFESSRIVPHLGELAAACVRAAVPLLVDAYHALGVLPFSLRRLGLESAFVTGGGYKYLQLGEGNAFLRLPPGVELRPILTGWYAEFETIGARSQWLNVAYPAGAAAFSGATYDPVSHYRAARVFDFFVERGLTPDLLRDVSRHQMARLASAFDQLALPDEIITRERGVALEGLAGFLSLESPYASDLGRRLAERGVSSDWRGNFLRLGPAPYLCDSQLDTAVSILGELAGSY